MSRKINCPNQPKAPYWYNEVPPEVFFNVDQFKHGQLVPIYQQKWQREIQDEGLDTQQRQILRNQRIARVYFNPMKLVLKPKLDKAQVEALREQREFKRKEKETVQILAKRRQNAMCAIYGVSHKEAGGESEIESTMSKMSTRGRICHKLRNMPPYSGKHALTVLPWDTMMVKPSTDRFQVKKFNDKLAGHRLLDEESKNVKNYTTTPVAVWRQHRFTSPEGCDFRELKEQVRVAKYKAMAQVQDKEASGKVRVGHAKLVSHFKPINAADDMPDCDDFFQDQALMEAARKDAEKWAAQIEAQRRHAAPHAEIEARADEAIIAARRRSEAVRSSRTSEQYYSGLNQRPRENHSFMVMKEKTEDGEGEERRKFSTGSRRSSKWRGRSSTLKEAKLEPPQKKLEVEESENKDGFFGSAVAADFTVEDEFMEDLMETCKETRDKLTTSLVPRPKGEFTQDPRTDPRYTVCFQKKKEKLTFLPN